MEFGDHTIHSESTPFGGRDSAPFSIVSEEIRNYIATLSADIERASREVNHIRQELDQLRTVITRFLEEYWGALESEFSLARLTEPAHETAPPQRTEAKQANIQADIPEPTVAEFFSVEQHIRALYKKLAKQFHPDVWDGNDPGVFFLIQEAYERGDLATLQLFDKQAEKMDVGMFSAVVMLESLEQRLQALLAEKDMLLSQHHRLRYSPENRLRKKAEWMQLCGKDLAKEVKHRIRNQYKEQSLLSEV